MAVSNLILNMIARTAQWVGPIKQAQRSVRELQETTADSAQSMNRLMRLGLASRVFTGLAEGVTEYHKAQREGTNALEMFVSKLPYIGNMSKAFNEMALEISGVAEEMERMASLSKMTGEHNTMYNKMERSYQLSLVSGDEEKKLQALYKYQDSLIAIDALENRIKSENQKYGEMYGLKPEEMFKFDKMRSMNLTEYFNALTEINTALEKKNKLEADEQSKNIWDYRKNIMNQIADMENRMAGMSEDMVSMLSRMRDIGAPFKDVQDMITEVRKLEEVRSRYEDMKEKGKLVDKTTLSDMDIMKRQQFQEVSPSLINVASLFPSQNPLVTIGNQQLQVLREIRDGQAA